MPEELWTVKADRKSSCGICRGAIYPGNVIAFQKGSRNDGTTVNRPCHATCLDPNFGRGSPAAPSGPTPSPAPPNGTPSSAGTTLGGRTDTSPPAPYSSDDPFVQVAAWVPVSRVGIMTEAIKRAREGTKSASGEPAPRGRSEP